MKRLSPTIERLILGLALAAGFVVMASVFAPDWTQADAPGPGFEEATTPGPVKVIPYRESSAKEAPIAPKLSMGTLEDDRFTVEIMATAAGPLYSIYERQTGEAVATMLTEEQVMLLFPELPIESMNATRDGAVMMVEPDAQR